MQTEYEITTPDDIGNFRFEPDNYPELDRVTFQKTLRAVYKKIIDQEHPNIVEIEEYVKNQGFEKAYIENAFAFFKLPQKDIAYMQCFMDSRDLADLEIRTVKDAGGQPDNKAIITHVLSTNRPIYQIKLKCKAFKKAGYPDGIIIFNFDFTEKIKTTLCETHGVIF